MKQAPGHCAETGYVTAAPPQTPISARSCCLQAGRVCPLSAVAHLFFPNHWPEALLQVQGRDTLYTMSAHWILLEAPLCVYKITASLHWAYSLPTLGEIPSAEMLLRRIL